MSRHCLLHILYTNIRRKINPNSTNMSEKGLMKEDKAEDTRKTASLFKLMHMV